MQTRQQYDAAAHPWAVIASTISKRHGRTNALSNFSLRAAHGTTVGLVGPTGAGKSTVISILCGLVRPSSGRVELLGQQPGSARLVGRVGLLPEGVPFPSEARVGAFVSSLARMQGLAEPRRAAESALQAVGGEAWVDLKFRELSYGMQRLVGIAQAYLGAPSVVFLDEPTEGLDESSIRRVKGLVSGAGGGVTTILSSHDLGFLEQCCDEIVSIDRGYITEQRQLTRSESKPSFSAGTKNVNCWPKKWGWSSIG